MNPQLEAGADTGAGMIAHRLSMEAGATLSDQRTALGRPDRYCAAARVLQPAPGRQTWIAPPTSPAWNAGCGAVAGPRATDPSVTRKTLPCHGQVRQPSARSLSDSGPDMWLHRSDSTCTAPLIRTA